MNRYLVRAWDDDTFASMHAEFASIEDARLWAWARLEEGFVVSVSLVSQP